MTTPSFLKQTAVGLLVAGALFTTGCQNYTAQSADFAQAWRAGQIQTATAEVQKKAAGHADDKDTVVWALEEGTVLRTAALANIAPPAPAATATGAAPAPEEAKPHDVVMAEKSNAAFERARAKIVKYDDQAKVKAGSEVGAALTNLANLPYRGRALDRVMLHTYLAANYLKTGELDKTRVELNRLLQAQRDAVEANAKRIAEAQEEAQKAKNNGDKSYDTEKSTSDPKVATAVNGMETELNSLVKGYEDYVNPFSVLLDGLFFAANAEGSSDFERARKSITRVAAMNPDNAYLKDDLAIASELHLGKSLDGTTYVVFETGSAPRLEEWRLDVPFFLFTGRVSYAGIALPRVKTDSNFLEQCVVTAAGQNYPTSLVASMDSVVAQEFKNEWPGVLTRTIISTGVKVAADAVIQNQVKDQGWAAQLAAKALTAAYGAATNIADTRSWSTLPKQFQYARVATPADGKITILVGNVPQEVTLPQGKVNLVWVRNVSPGAPTYISTSILKN